MSHYIATNFNTPIPALYEQQDSDEIIAKAIYYVPYSDWKWIVLEFSKLQNLFYCYVLPEQEYQYVTIDKLIQMAYEYDVEVILDTDFVPKPLKELINEV